MTGWKEDYEGWQEASKTNWYKDIKKQYDELDYNECLFTDAVIQANLDDAIKYLEEIANSKLDNQLVHKYKQLLNWLRELKQYTKN